MKTFKKFAAVAALVLSLGMVGLLSSCGLVTKWVIQNDTKIDLIVAVAEQDSLSNAQSYTVKAGDIKITDFSYLNESIYTLAAPANAADYAYYVGIKTEQKDNYIRYYHN